MNKLQLIGLFLLSFASLKAQELKVEWPSPLEFDFGTLQSDQTYTHFFIFQNISKDTLQIENVRPDCSCTVPNWEETPILPLQIDSIRVDFTPKRPGYFKEKVRVFFDKQKKGVMLRIQGFVE